MSHQRITAPPEAKTASVQQDNLAEPQSPALRKVQPAPGLKETSAILELLVERLAHSIKNPMTAIGTFLQMLPEKYQDTSFRESFLEVALAEHYRINTIIDTLLDAVDDRAPCRSWTNLNTLIGNRLRQIDEKCRHKSISVATIFSDNPLMAFIDSDMIGTVVSNVLENAVEASPPGALIRTETRLLQENTAGGNVHIQIIDNGPGISENLAGSLFLPFFTTKHSNAENPCPGFGLFVAHKYMQAHGGAISMYTAPGSGVNVALMLPVKPDNRNGE